MKVSMNELYECILYQKANKNIKEKKKIFKKLVKCSVSQLQKKAGNGKREVNK